MASLYKDTWCQTINDYCKAVLRGSDEAFWCDNISLLVRNRFTSFQDKTKWRFTHTRLPEYVGCRMSLKEWVLTVYGELTARPYDKGFQNYPLQKQLRIVVGILWGTLGDSVINLFRPQRRQRQR